MQHDETHLRLPHPATAADAAVGGDEEGAGRRRDERAPAAADSDCDRAELARRSTSCRFAVPNRVAMALFW